MISYLLDTNVISETRKPRPHGGVMSWIASLTAEQILVPAVSIGELQIGIEKTRTQDPARAESLERWLASFAASHQILAMDEICFREWGRISQKASNTLIVDAMIAATARVHGLTVATRNTGDFGQFAVSVFNPFTYRD